ncbi:MAG: hypothetical protein JNM93_02600 [Bacteriovoracaceae bacterium]|nr:hypothetical protein [Bacteriovoracaceae bacterium]
MLNKARAGIEKKFFDLCSKVIVEEGFELYDMDYLTGSSTLRVFIQNPTTKNAVIEDCVKIDRALSPYIDTEEWVPSALVLEVSSPGVFRNLRTIEHFTDAQGKIISAVITGNVDENLNKGLKGSLLKQKKFRGVLKSVNENGIEISVEDMNVKLNFEQIKKSNLDPELNG